LKDSRAPLWKAWLPACIWLGIIVLESTNLGSSEHTFRYLYPIFHFLFGIDQARFLVWNHVLRKSGHVAGYFVLSWLLFRAWRATIPARVGRTLPSAGNPPSRLAADSPSALRRWSFSWARVSFLMTVLVASLDEWHQSYLPSRTGRWQDAVLDSCAALAAQLLLWLVLRRRAESG
jgi:VanZ family protein